MKSLKIFDYTVILLLWRKLEMNEIKDKYIQVSENVFTTLATRKEFRGDLRPAHTSLMTCISLPGELVFVDCGMNIAFAKEFREDMEKHFAKKTSHLILTHMHEDHFMAMEVFKDVKIVAPEIGVEIIKPDVLSPPEDIHIQLAKNAEEYSDSAEIVSTIKNGLWFLPNTPIASEMTIGPEGHELVVKVTGGHSKDSSYIYSAKEKLVCTGDNIVTSYAQYVFDPLVIDVYKKWESLDVDHFISGHGSIVDKKFISNVRKYFEELLSTLKQLKKQNIPLAEIASHPDIPEYFGQKEKGWIDGGDMHTKWLEFVIKVWYEKFT